MASKNVLTEAITKLVSSNALLYEKMRKEKDEKKKSDILKEINRNNAMILDYKFRIEYDD
jgi:hypothetical protein